MIAFQFRVDAFQPVGAPELVQRADDALRRGAQLLVALVAAVIVAVTLLLNRYTGGIIGVEFLAWEIAFLARSVCWKKNTAKMHNQGNIKNEKINAFDYHSRRNYRNGYAVRGTEVFSGHFQRTALTGTPYTPRGMMTTREKGKGPQPHVISNLFRRMG